MDWAATMAEESMTNSSDGFDLRDPAAMNDQTLVGDFEEIPDEPIVSASPPQRAITPEQSLIPRAIGAINDAPRRNSRNNSGSARLTISMLPQPIRSESDLRLNCDVCFNNASATGFCSYPCPKFWPKHLNAIGVATAWPPRQQAESMSGLNCALFTFRSDGDQTLGKYLFESVDLIPMTIHEFLALKLKVAIHSPTGPIVVQDRDWIRQVQSVANYMLVPKSWALSIPIIREYCRRAKENQM